MTLSREEIRRDVAVRMACALIARDGYDDEGAPRDAVTLADALLAALTLTPAPVAPPAPTPAPEAKRPTHVRVTRLAHSDRPATVGKVYEVVRWNYDGSPDVIGDNGSNMSLSKPDGSDEKVWPAWEPAPCPPPVAGSAEDVAVRDAEARVIAAAIAWNAKYNSDEVKYLEGAHSERLDLNDAVAALAEARAALSSPVRP